MQIRNILFENIRVNWKGQKYLIEMVPQATKWSNPPAGSIQNVIFDNVSVNGNYITRDSKQLAVGKNVAELQFSSGTKQP